MKRLTGYLVAALIAVGALAGLVLAAASLIFLKLQGIDGVPMPTALWSWLIYYHGWGNDARVRPNLLLAIGAPTAFVLILAGVMVVAAFGRKRRLRPAQPGQRFPAPVRAASDAHGTADWMSMVEVRKLFPGPHPAYGGVVVGEAYRVDQDAVAGQRFDPDNRSSCIKRHPEPSQGRRREPSHLRYCGAPAVAGAGVALSSPERRFSRSR